MLVLLLLLISLLVMAIPSSSMQFALGFGERKCFSEEVPTDRPLLVDFHTAAGASNMDLDLFVTNTEGQVVFHKSGLSHHRATLEQHTVQHMPAFTAYRFCLMHQTIPGQIMERAERKVEFEIRPVVREGDAARLVRRGQADNAYQNLRRLEGEIMELVEMMDALRKQEQLLTSTNESTSRFLMTLSSLASLFVLVVGMLQLEMVQGVLKQRKFIR